MEFLRNRIIEAGHLRRPRPRLEPEAWRTVDLAPTSSSDRRGGQEIGFDIARDYDNTGKWLQLTVVRGWPGLALQGYSPRPNCN